MYTCELCDTLLKEEMKTGICEECLEEEEE